MVAKYEFKNELYFQQIDIEELVKARMSTNEKYLKKFFQDNENKLKSK